MIRTAATPSFAYVGLVPAMASALLLSFGAPSPAAVVEQDGIIAQADVAGSSTVLRWRFLRPLETPLSAVSASLNGRPLPALEIKAYPGAGDRTVVMFVLDVSAGRGEGALDRDRAILLRMAGRIAPHHVVGLMAYAADAQLVQVKSGSLDEFVDAVVAIEQSSEKSRPAQALSKALVALSRVPASRGGLFVFTDEAPGNATERDQIVALARQLGVTLTFIARTPPAALAAMARETNGEVVAAERVESFLKQPFALLDSGAEAAFAFADVWRLPWEAEEADLRFELRYGEKTLDVPLKVGVPRASWPQSAKAVLALDTGPAAAAGILAVALGIYLVRRRSLRRLAPDSARAVRDTLAMLEDIELGTIYPVNAPLVRIGRNKDNDIVLKEASVGRFHAVLQQTGDQSFSIVDQASKNGTLINNKRVQSATLMEGDLISLGSKILRFRKGCADAAPGAA